MRTARYPQGTRVRIRRGRFPLDPALEGRTGVVVRLDPYRPDLYGVLVDGAPGIVELREEELEPDPSSGGSRT